MTTPAAYWCIMMGSWWGLLPGGRPAPTTPTTNSSLRWRPICGVRAYTALYQQARAQASAPLPFFVRDHLGEPTLHLADSLGAQTIQMVPPATMPTASAQNLRGHASVRPARSVSYPEFEQAYVDFYEWTHASWHPVSGDHRPVLARHAAEAYNSYSSVVLDTGGQVCALITVFPGNQPELCGETTTPAAYQGNCS